VKTRQIACSLVLLCSFGAFAAGWEPMNVTLFKPALDAITRGDEAEFKRLIAPFLRDGNESAIIVYAAHLERKKQYAESIDLLRPLADMGNGDAQFALARTLSFSGRQKESDVWLQRAAKQGQQDAVELVTTQSIPAPRAVNGQYRIGAFVAYLQALLPLKAAHVPDDKVACYGKPKEQVVALFRSAASSCGAELSRTVGTSIPESKAIDQFGWMTHCANNTVLQQVGVTPSEWAVCLGPK
jgi:TPR repeat protein